MPVSLKPPPKTSSDGRTIKTPIRSKDSITKHNRFYLILSIQTLFYVLFATGHKCEKLNLIMFRAPANKRGGMQCDEVSLQNVSPVQAESLWRKTPECSEQFSLTG